MGDNQRLSENAPILGRSCEKLVNVKTLNFHLLLTINSSCDPHPPHEKTVLSFSTVIVNRGG